MKQYAADYLSFVIELKAEYDRKAFTMKKEDREDDSVQYRIKSNICDIFYRMAVTSDKKNEALKLADEKEQISKFNEDYLSWFEKIPENWKINLEKARKYKDAVTIKTEEEKLDTASILRNKFMEFSGTESPAFGTKADIPALQAAAAMQTSNNTSSTGRSIQ